MATFNCYYVITIILGNIVEMGINFIDTIVVRHSLREGNCLRRQASIASRIHGKRNNEG